MTDYIYILAIYDQQQKLIFTRRRDVTHWYNGQRNEAGIHVPLAGQQVLPFVYAASAALTPGQVLDKWRQQSGVQLDLQQTQFLLRGSQAAIVTSVVADCGALCATVQKNVAADASAGQPQLGTLEHWTFDGVAACPAADLLRLANAVVVPPLPAERYQYYLKLQFELLMASHTLALHLTPHTPPETPPEKPLAPLTPAQTPSDTPRLLAVLGGDEE